MPSVIIILANVNATLMPMVENVMNVNLATGTFQLVNFVNVMVMHRLVMQQRANVLTVMITLMDSNAKFV
jgi:hypothetical protein